MGHLSGYRTLSVAAVVLAGQVMGFVPAGRASALGAAYDEREEQVTVPHRSLKLTCARPRAAAPPAFLILFASGDGGLRGGSRAVYEHMAEQGHYVAAFSSREALGPVKSAGGVLALADATIDIGAMIHEAKRLLDLPETTPTVVTGESRGANMVVFAAGDPVLKPGIAGAVAIALTREADFLKIPAEQQSQFQVDAKGRVQTYPALTRLGSIPVSVIQSTNDKYVRSAESRRLLGPDTATRRLYEVKSSNHGFSGGRDTMLRNLDESLSWIAAALSSRGAAAN